MVDKLLKRDGTTQEFLAFKIEDAIKKAFGSENTTYDPTVFQNVLNKLENRRQIAVEDIQEIGRAHV